MVEREWLDTGDEPTGSPVVPLDLPTSSHHMRRLDTGELGSEP